jgi:hypothetical protein
MSKTVEHTDRIQDAPDDLALRVSPGVLETAGLIREVRPYQRDRFRERLGIVVRRAEGYYRSNGRKLQPLRELASEIMGPDSNLPELYRKTITELYSRLTQDQIQSLFKRAHETILCQPDLSFMVHEPLDAYIQRELPAAVKSVQVLQDIEAKRGRGHIIVRVPTLGMYYPPFTKGLKKRLHAVEASNEDLVASPEKVAKSMGRSRRLLIQERFPITLDWPPEEIELVRAIHSFAQEHELDVVVLDNSGHRRSKKQFHFEKYARDGIFEEPSVIVSKENGFTVPDGLSPDKPVPFILNPKLDKKKADGSPKFSSIDGRNFLTDEEGILVFDERGGVTTLHRMFFQKFGDAVEKRAFRQT